MGKPTTKRLHLTVALLMAVVVLLVYPAMQGHGEPSPARPARETRLKTTDEYLQQGDEQGLLDSVFDVAAARRQPTTGDGQQEDAEDEKLRKVYHEDYTFKARPLRQRARPWRTLQLQAVVDRRRTLVREAGPTPPAAKSKPRSTAAPSPVQPVLSPRQAARRTAAPTPPRRPPSPLRVRASLLAEPSGGAGDGPSGGEKYLMLPAVQVGFASGIWSTILPFLLLAAEVGRTAVLPQMQFTIPAFRSGSDPQFLKMSDFIDMPGLLKQLPCVSVITYAEWKQQTEATVDVLLQFGLPEEFREKISPQAPPNPNREAYKTDCIAIKPKVKTRPTTTRQPSAFWGGPFGHSQEVEFLHASEGLIIHETACVSFHTTLSAASTFKHMSDAPTVMIYNVFGAVRGPYVSGGGYMQGIVKMFRDIPQKNLCKKQGYDSTYPDFRKWPALAPSWINLGKKFSADLSEGSGFTCVQIRGEKMILRAFADKKIGPVSSLRPSDPYMGKCVQAMIDLIEAQSEGPLFLVTDMDPKMGSPSAARSGSLRNWNDATFKQLKEAFPKSKTYCGSEAHDVHKSDDDPVVARVLSAYDGNCAIAETAICRQANNVVRFGSGSMGDFIVGDSPLAWYKTCEDVLSGHKITRVVTDDA